MNNGIFVTGTGTDVGKTYVSALLIKTLREKGINVGYYKAAISGAEDIGTSDAGYVNRVANIGQQEDTLLSYLYKTPLSPHLAAKLEGNPAQLKTIIDDYKRVKTTYAFTLAEGSGGIVCPIRYDESEQILLEDIVKALHLPVVIVTLSGLGSINASVLTAAYLRQKGIDVCGFIMNRFDGSLLHKDNKQMIETLTELPVLSCVNDNAERLELSDFACEKMIGEVR